MKIWLVAMLIFVGDIIFAQGKYDVNWCFGIKAGINFADTAHPVNFNTLANEDYTAACISDSLGNLLFYVAPDSFYSLGIARTPNAIYNKNNEIIDNGDSINVSYDLTGALFLPVPQTANSYYFFYMSWYDYDNLHYAKIVYDSSISTYTVIEKNKNLNTSSLEFGITAVKHANGNDWWMLVHESDSISPTNSFYEYLITKDSILGPYTQDIGSLHYSEGVNVDQPKFSKSGDWLASPLADQNGVDLFNFDRCTGQLQNFITLDSIDSLGDDVIDDCEFSADGNKLYVSEGFGNVSSKSALYQYDLTDSNINSSKITLYTTDSGQTTFGDLLRAPDNKIYLAVEYNQVAPYYARYNKFNSYLWVINNPDSSGLACNFQPYGYFLGDTLNDSARVYWGLPNMPNYNLTALSIYQGMGNDTTICNTDSITIGNPPVADVAYQWQGPGITNATSSQLTVKPDTSTWYYVTLTDTTINYSCQSVTDSFFVQVKQCCDSLLLAQCTLSKDTFICTNIDTPTKGAILLVDTVPGVSFKWLPGFDIDTNHVTTQIVDPAQSTWYYVLFYSDSDSSVACNKRLDSVYVKVEKCDTNGIENISAVTQHLIIYPNPAQNIAVVEWQPMAALEATVEIYDMVGREVASQQISGGKAQVNVSGLEDGLYVVKVMSPSGGGGIFSSAKLTVIK